MYGDTNLRNYHGHDAYRCILLFKKSEKIDTFVFSGFVMHENQGIIFLNIINSMSDAQKVPIDCICLAIINNKVKTSCKNVVSVKGGFEM